MPSIWEMIWNALVYYVLCGIAIALVISTVDLVTPEKPEMGVVWTIVSSVVWPAFLIVVVAYVLGWRPKRR